MKYNLVLVAKNDQIAGVYVWWYGGSKTFAPVNQLRCYEFVEYSEKAALAMANELRAKIQDSVKVMDTATTKRALIDHVLRA